MGDAEADIFDNLMVNLSTDTVPASTHEPITVPTPMSDIDKAAKDLNRELGLKPGMRRFLIDDANHPNLYIDLPAPDSYCAGFVFESDDDSTDFSGVGI